MGLFLSMSGIAGVTGPEVEKALAAYAQENGGKLEALPTHQPEHDVLVINSENANRVTVLYPSHFSEWDKVSAYLSAVLKKPTFAFHLHDGDLWMYVLFVNGKETTQFNPIPEYWDDSISEEERKKWTGDSALVCRHWPDVKSPDIEKYLVHWDLHTTDGSSKAYPDDEFYIGEDWQLCDFMRKLGLAFPVDHNGNPQGKMYRFTF